MIKRKKNKHYKFTTKKKDFIKLEWMMGKLKILEVNIYDDDGGCSIKKILNDMMGKPKILEVDDDDDDSCRI